MDTWEVEVDFRDKARSVFLSKIGTIWHVHIVYMAILDVSMSLCVGAICTIWNSYTGPHEASALEIQGAEANEVWGLVVPECMYTIYICLGRGLLAIRKNELEEAQPMKRWPSTFTGQGSNWFVKGEEGAGTLKREGVRLKGQTLHGWESATQLQYNGLGRFSFQKETPATGTRRVIISGEADEPPAYRKAAHICVFKHTYDMSVLFVCLFFTYSGGMHEGIGTSKVRNDNITGNIRSEKEHGTRGIV
jgi:hypothetical protein